MSHFVTCVTQLYSLFNAICKCNVSNCKFQTYNPLDSPPLLVFWKIGFGDSPPTRIYIFICYQLLNQYNALFIKTIKQTILMVTWGNGKTAKGNMKNVWCF